MGITIVAIGAGLIIGLLTGGRIQHLSDRTFRLSLLFFLGIALQLVVTYGPAHLPVVILLGSYLCIAVFALVNLDLRGMGLIAIGILLNFVVIAVNRGMPVDPRAVRAAGVYTERQLEHKVIQGKRHLQRPDDRLLWLSDTIPVRLPGYPQVVSFGDLILYFGVADLMVHLLRPSRRLPQGQARLAGYAADDSGDAGGDDGGDDGLPNTEVSSR